MNGWLTFWTWALVIALSFFAIVVVTVTIGGLRDIRDMLRSLKAGHAAGDGDPTDRDGPVHNADRNEPG